MEHRWGQRAAPGILAIEWMMLAPDAVVRQLEAVTLKLVPAGEMAVA